MIAVRFRGKFGANPSQPSLPLRLFHMEMMKQSLIVGILTGAAGDDAVHHSIFGYEKCSRF